MSCLPPHTQSMTSPPPCQESAPTKFYLPTGRYGGDWRIARDNLQNTGKKYSKRSYLNFLLTKRIMIIPDVYLFMPVNLSF